MIKGARAGISTWLCARWSVARGNWAYTLGSWSYVAFVPQAIGLTLFYNRIYGVPNGSISVFIGMRS